MTMLDFKNDPVLTAKIDDLIQYCNVKNAVQSDLRSEIVSQMVINSLKLLDGYDLGQVKLMNRALKEMRYAFKIFGQYPDSRKASIFGSARTPPEHPDYLAARAFSTALAERGWMCITGGAQGIMKAGLEGQPTDARFGLSIQLPFEKVINDLLIGDQKSLIFRYFFTRKLMFMSHADALIAFPGGVGTMDELFEALTLIQTGKNPIIPIILMEGTAGNYWNNWRNFIASNLLANKFIDEADLSLFYIAKSVEDGAKQIDRFYKRYHSSRYVGDMLVIRMLSEISDADLVDLNSKFSSIVESGTITQSKMLVEENEFPELPRLIFHFNRRKYSLLRILIDTINDYT